MNDQTVTRKSTRTDIWPAGYGYARSAAVCIWAGIFLMVMSVPSYLPDLIVYLPELAPWSNDRLLRLHRAGPSTSLDKSAAGARFIKVIKTQELFFVKH